MTESRFAIFETAEQKLDRLIFAGRLHLTPEGVAHWCHIGKHPITHPLQSPVTQAWWDEVCDRLIADHERCAGEGI